MDDQQQRIRRGIVRALVFTMLVGVSSLLVPGLAVAEASGELSTADRLRILYTTQLTFTPRGDPIIRLGLVENINEVTFKASEPFLVLPQGPGGPEVEFPGGQTYKVRADRINPGKYKHYVIVERLPVDQRKRIKSIKSKWLARGYIPEVFEVGGLFAVRGKVFDSRTILLTVGGTPSTKPALTLQTKLRAKFGIEGGVHSQLVEHPSAMLTLTGDGVKVQLRHRDILQITAKPGRDESIRYTISDIPKNYVQGTETRTYTGDLIFAPSRDGNLFVINSLGAERALRGVVPSEIYASAPQAALQAQAIAARNEIFSAVGVRNLADPYMLRADVMDQVYKGVGAEDARTTRAVRATRGKVMFYGDQIIEAFYSSNAGGFTEHNENVWNMEPRPYLRGHADAPDSAVPRAFQDTISEAELDRFLSDGFDAHSKSAPVSSAKFFRWSTSVPASKPSAWLKDAGYKVGKLRDVKVLSRGVSGRVIQLELSGTRGKALIERELNVRRLFGGLKSGLFTVKTERDRAGNITQFHFRGAGFGHGVGMCQTGAVGMAAKGSASSQILRHYYRGIDIRRLY
ncbi:MAG: SpoIID/LytB domain-containing protein [Myxococcota bacterium]